MALSKTLLSLSLLLTSCALLTTGCKTKTPTQRAALKETKGAIEVEDSGCPHADTGSCSDTPAPQVNKGSKTSRYGEPLGDAPLVSLSKLLSNPSQYNEKTIQVSGLINRVCTKKGCWMEIAESKKDSAHGCRVTFKDYGFLVPVDSKGSLAKLEGKVQLTKVEKSAVDHYEGEGATFPNKEADGTAHEVRLVATGVEISKS